MSRTSSRDSRLIKVKKASKSTRRKRSKRENSKEFRVVNKTWDSTNNQSTRARNEKKNYSSERSHKKGYSIKKNNSNPKKKFQKMMQKISKNSNEINIMDRSRRVKLNMGDSNIS